MEDRVFGFLCNNPQVKDYFSAYRREDWNSVLLSTVLFGIFSIQTTHNRVLSIQELHEKLKRAGAIKNIEENIPSLKSKLNSLRKEISVLEDQLEEKPKKVEIELEPEPLSKPKTKGKKVDFWNQTDFKKKQTEVKVPVSKEKTRKAWAHDFSEVVKNSPTVYDDSISNGKESRLEESSQMKSQDYKDSLENKHSGFDKKFLTDAKEKLSIESKEFHKFSSGSNENAYSGSKYKSSGSSMSHYNPSEDMKRFYRNEFGKFLESKGPNREESD